MGQIDIGRLKEILIEIKRIEMWEMKMLKSKKEDDDDNKEGEEKPSVH